MLKQERIRLMDDYIAQKGFVSLDELCETFSVSMNTVRSDVREIITAGRAQKTYGGVTALPAAHYTSYEVREGEHAASKQLIARAAAQMVDDGDIIYIDVGTTCLPMVDYIPQEYNITIITMDLAVIGKAALRPNTKLMTMGGTYQRHSNSFKCTFPALHSYIDAFNITKAFLGTTGVSPTGMLTNSENFGREMRSLVIQRCPECYLLADTTKFGRAALMSYGSLRDLAACITTQDLSEKYRKLCRDMGVRLIMADLPK